MTDRELLELAAKAAGTEVDFRFTFEGKYETHVGKWNPLTDDGDALRLAVKLERFLDAGFWSKVFEARNGFDFGVDEFAATRRAIVRAAAEIGRSMK